MLRLFNYIKISLLIFTMVVASLSSFAQTNAKIVRERDSLLNLISKETDTRKLSGLYLELANKYQLLVRTQSPLQQGATYQKLIEAAQKSVTLAKNSKDYSVLLSDYLLLGQVYITVDEPIKSIESYLSARKVLEKNPDKETDADIVTQIGLVYFYRQHYQRASESFNEALAVYKNLQKDDKIIENSRYLATCESMLGNNAEAVKYYEYLLEKYKERNDWQNTKMVYQRLNEVYQKEKDYDKVYKSNYELYNLCTQHNNIKESLNALNNVAYCYVCIHKYDKAVKYYKQLLASDNSVSNDEKLNAGTYTSLGLCYQNMNDNEQAIANLQKAADLRQRYNQIYDAATVNNIIALIYYKDQDLHNAEFYAISAVEDAEKVAAEGGDDDGELRKAVYQTYNKILEAKGEDKKATEYYKKYLSLRDSAQVRQQLLDRDRAQDLKELTDAEKKFQQSLVDEEISELSNKQLQLLAEARQKEIELLNKNYEIQEMEKKRIEQSLALARQQQEALKRENEIQQLQQQRKNDELELARKEAEEKERQNEIELLEQQKKNQEMTIANQQKTARQMQLIIFMALAMLIFFIIVFILMRKKNKQLKEQQNKIEMQNADLVMKNEEITVQKENLMLANNEIMTINNELSRQKEIIEKANKSITDSIVYAKRIQTAVCPSPTFLSAFNFDYFLFFRPRDIVSGDYYWFYSDNENYVYIVAADCTGHGVPGAFMSMLGVSLFNKIVTERNVLEPAEILTNLRKEVKKALHQDSINSSQKDGMDLSFVKFNLKTNVLTFSGANNNGFLVQRFSHDEEDKAKENLAKPEFLRESIGGYLKLTVMPADPMPIGVFVREKEKFSQTSYQLRKGDSFYLTSDGYIDQFGGENGRKFLTKNFEKMLLDMNPYSMKRQERIVQDTHETWIGETYTQLDDIIVIGIRV